MRTMRLTYGMIVLACLALLGVFPAEAERRMPIEVSPLTKRPVENAQSGAEGKVIYEQACLKCHGVKGKGEGPVAFFLSRDTGPHPRDFTFGVYKFRSTLSGYLPTDEDLFRTITEGMAGFMPSFTGLSPDDRWKVVYFIKTFTPLFKDAKPVHIKVVGGPIPSTAASVRRGYEVYQELKCWECHGGTGLGDGEKAPTLKDDWGFLLPPADLTMPSSFKAGSRPEDLYRTVLSGLDGSAMPSYSDALAGREEDAWHLANFILSLSASGSR